MLKRTLLVGAVALGLSGVALANGDVMPSCPADTFTPGFYVGLQAGYGMTGWDNNFSGNNNDGTNKTNAIVGRIFAGYDFNKYFAAELGYMRFLQKTTLQIDTTDYYKVTTSAVDLLGKIKAPITDSFGVYAKAGVAYLMSSIDNQAAATGANLLNNMNHFGVAYGVGVNYNITSNLTTDLSWMHYTGRAKVNRAPTLDVYQPSPDLFMLGIAYKFNF